MKKLYSLFTALVICGCSFAKDVNVGYAMQVAKNFYQQNHPEAGSFDITLAYELKAPLNVGSALDGRPVYYVFDISGSKGFVIIAGDDLVEPVLGYNTSGSYPTGHVNPAAAKWMENYKNQIIYVKHNIDQTTTEITRKWDSYYNNIPVANNDPSRAAQAVNPLCQTQWNQAPNENGQCPYDNNYGQRTVTGCVATAMAQIMKFWNYPTQGTGFRSYNAQNYGTQSANFGSTTYNWGGMPNVLNSANNDVATLMYHCGVSVEMKYGVAQTGGSSAYVVASMSPGQACAEYSYKTYFGYDPATLQGVVRDNYSDATWANMMKGELDAGRPIQYAGFGGGGGHTWVCDGYDNNNFFHQNWGWGGNSDGFFSLNNLDPTSLGAGGGTGGFNSGQQAVIGIKPLNGGGGGGGGGGTINQNGIVLYAATTVSANPFQSGGAFSVYADIANSGTTSFTGDFAAAIFDNNGVFIQYIQQFTNETAQAGFHYQVTFSTNQLQLIPGTYYIGLYYKNGSNNYSLINAGSFFNPVTITVTGPYSDIQMSAATVATPSPLVKGQTANIGTSMQNAGSSTFTGYLSADVFNLDGTYVGNLEEFQVTLNGQTNYTVTFVNNSLNINAGTYLLAYFSTTDRQNYTMVYGQNFPNPVEITIVEPGLSPDQYENNNTEGSPYTFTPSFSGNNASVLTTGSNMHLGNDYDYYTVNLPGGTNYAITARVHDSYSSGNGQSYNNDVQFSYKVNGGSWSNTYDDVMGGNIVVQGGGSVTFFVADYFQGTTGSYLLDLQIARGANVGINEVNKNNISVFPNPTHGTLYIDAADATGNYDLRIYNILGEQVSGQNGTFATDLIKTDVSALVPGVYTLQLKTATGLSSSKFIVK